ncbi:TolC family protein [uncultured Helicobacter sp.]|uniref:TolC family protein n=1 Tax=uncultured Helicobacter sp. TaxID=175537 RepID=UPI00261D10A1|nr:TolC family protein [uncultured Helicobacter sp.]
MRKFGVCLALVCFSYGLDINESVQKALQKSHKIEEQRHILSSLKAQLGVYEGAYYPKIDLKNQSVYDTRESFGNKTSLQLSTNLFNGMSDYNSIKRQEKIIQAQDDEVFKIQSEVKYNIKKLYTQILLAKGLLETSEESAKLLELQLAQANQFYKQGISAKNNVLSVEVSLASAKLDINSYMTRLRYLLASLELLIEEKVDLNSLKDLASCEVELNYDQLSLIIFEHQQEYRKMQKQEEALLFDIQSAKGDYYPKIDLSIGGDINAGVQTYSQAKIQLGITLNLFNGLKDSSTIQSKRYELLSLHSKMQAYKKEVLSNLRQAVGDFNLAKDQYLLSKKTIQSAQENYRIVSNRYKQNLENATTLLDAELMLKTARANLLQAQYGIWENLFYVEYLVGREVEGFLIQ